MDERINILRKYNLWGDTHLILDSGVVNTMKRLWTLQETDL